MNYGFIYHNNKQTKSPMLRFQKSKQKKISDTTRTNAAVFCGVTGKNFLNTFRKSSKDKSNLKYKTSKNSPNSSHKKIEVVEEYKKLSNEHKDTQPGGKDANSKKRKNINKNDLYDDLFLKKVKKIYPKGFQNNYNTKLKKSGSNLFNMHSSNIKDQNNNNHKKENKKHLYSNNISKMDYSGKLHHHHIDNSSEENNIFFNNNNNNKNHSIIGNSLNPLGIMVNSSSILPIGNNTNLNLNEMGNKQNNALNINNNIINNISNLININGNETGFVSNYNLMKHIENKYEKNGINNYADKTKEPMMEKAFSNINIKSGNHSKPSSKGKISNINSFNIGNNKFIYPKFMVKYGEENYSNLNANNISKKSNGSLENGEKTGIGAYFEFTKLNKTAYPSKTNSSKNSLDKRKSKLIGNKNHNNIYINNDSLLQSPEDNNLNETAINTNRDKSSENNINIIDNNMSNEIPIQDQSKSSKDPLNNNINVNNSGNNTFYSTTNNLIKSSKLSNNNSNHNSTTNINNNINKNVNVIINNSNKNISIINVNNISYNKQKKIEINNNGICNTNRVKNNNYLIKKISGMQARPYVEYISTADKNRNTTNMTNADKKNKKNTEKNLDNNSNVIKIFHYKKTPMTKTKSCYGRHELHNRSNSGLLTSNQLDMIVSDIIFKKKITRISKDFNTSLNSKNSKSKSKSKKNREDSYHKGNNTSRPETNKNRLIKNSVPRSSCQSPGMKLNNILLESNNNTGNHIHEKIMPSEISERRSVNNINNSNNNNNLKESANNTNKNNNSSKYLNINIEGEDIEKQKLKLYNEIKEKISSKENSIDNNHKNKSSNTSRCLNYKEIEFNKLSSNLNKQKSYINNDNLSLLEKKIIKNFKEEIKLGLITNNTKNLISKKEQIRDNNSTGLKKHLKSQKLIKDLHVFNPKLIKYHLLNAGKVIDKSSNQSKRESKDKIKKNSVENKLSVTPPKSDKYIKKISNSNINNINNIANVLSTNKKEIEKEIEKEISKNKEKDLKENINNLYEELKPQKLLKIDNYNLYKEMLCEPSSSIKIKEDNVHLTTTASHDCNFYKNEMEKLSIYIKNYYLENGCYPKTNNQFYLFGRQIGHGAFGKVNISLHVASGRLVAIKTFTKKNLKNKHARNKIKH